MKKNMILLMVVLIALCWYVTVGAWMEKEENYKAAIANAESFEERELYLDAIAEYKTAMNYSEDHEGIMMKIAHDYQKMGDPESYVAQLESVVSSYGPNEEAVREIFQFYVESNREEKAITYIAALREKYPGNAVVEEHYKLAQQNYFELYHSFQGLGEYYGSYAMYEHEGKKGIVNAAGEVILEAIYDAVEVPENREDGFPVRYGNQVYMVSVDGYKIAQPEGNFEELGVLADQRILAKKNGKYGYLDEKMSEKTEFIWEDATNFHMKIAAVKSGGKWALMNRSGELLTEYVYEDVKRDEHNFCSRNGLIWVKENGSYRLINAELEAVGEGSFEDVKAFLAEEPCAVCRSGKWGFVDTQGQLVISCNAEDAGSFRLGYAPVKSDGLWGFIGMDGSLLIEYAYDEAKSFNNRGTAPVRRENVWKLIQLGLYK